MLDYAAIINEVRAHLKTMLAHGQNLTELRNLSESQTFLLSIPEQYAARFLEVMDVLAQDYAAAAAAGEAVVGKQAQIVSDVLIHDLRSPLGTMINASLLLLDDEYEPDYPLLPTDKQHLQAIHNAGMAALLLIEQIIDARRQ